MIRLLLQELRFRRNAIIGWAIGLSFVPTLYVSLYPSFEDQLEGMQDILDLPIYQAMGMNFGNFEDWVASTVLTIIPIILSIYAVIDGTGTLAGEEDSGKLELVVTLPIPRWQILMHLHAGAIGWITLSVIGRTGIGRFAPFPLNCTWPLPASPERSLPTFRPSGVASLSLYLNPLVPAGVQQAFPAQIPLGGISDSESKTPAS